MDTISIFAFAGIFYVAAEYERMTGWQWAVASVLVSATVKGLFPLSFILVLPAQAGLFGVLWWANTRRLAALEVERAGRRAEDQRVRQERARLSREHVDPATVAREAAEAAKADAATRERQERVRLVREQREREERERKQSPEQ